MSRYTYKRREETRKKYCTMCRQIGVEYGERDSLRIYARWLINEGYAKQKTIDTFIQNMAGLLYDQGYDVENPGSFNMGEKSKKRKRFTSIQVDQMILFYIKKESETENIYRKRTSIRNAEMIKRMASKCLRPNDVRAEMDRNGRFLCIIHEPSSNSIGKIIEYHQIWRIVRNALKGIGITDKGYSAYSFSYGIKYESPIMTKKTVVGPQQEQ